MQRVALREALLCRTGIVPNTGAWYGPGSAAHQAVKDGPLRCVRGSKKIEKYSRMAILAFSGGLILLVSCPRRGRFLEATFRWAERELAGPGRPGTVDGLRAKGGAPGGAAPRLGRARCLGRARW